MKHRFLRWLLPALVVSCAFATASVYARRSSERRLQDEMRYSAEVIREALAKAPPPETTSELIVTRGTTFSDLLQQLEVEPETGAQVMRATQRVFNLRRLQPGNHMALTRNRLGTIRELRYQVDPDHELLVVNDKSDFKAEIHEIPSTVKIVTVAAELQTSLFESVLQAGERPELALRLAEIFAWDLDFYTDPRTGDTFRLVLEKRERTNGQPASYGRILMAEYNNAGHLYQAVLFHDDSGRPAYYSADGKSLQKAFLRSPLKFAARVSSHFSRNRFHPVLKIYRPHLGTDYAAPTGTPVQAIASGKVVFSGTENGGGNVVEIQHAMGYRTYYMHLSRRLVRTGQRVEQGQRIGLVGATGLATGPHLDFRIRQHGAFVNFERMKPAPALPVAKRDFAAFTAERDRWLPRLLAAGNHADGGVAPSATQRTHVAGQ
jgi:murein DD-endopeptidase MepM/ murein hydrolase activator NlpD